MAGQPVPPPEIAGLMKGKPMVGVKLGTLRRASSYIPAYTTYIWIFCFCKGNNGVVICCEELFFFRPDHKPWTQTGCHTSFKPPRPGLHQPLQSSQWFFGQLQCTTTAQHVDPELCLVTERAGGVGIRLVGMRSIDTLQGMNVSHLGKRQIIFKRALIGDVLVSRRVDTWYIVCDTSYKWYVNIWYVKDDLRYDKSVHMCVYVYSSIWYIYIIHIQWL